MTNCPQEHPWVTKKGIDPLLSEEENTSNLVEPPTEEEMNRAITGNLGNIIVVVGLHRDDCLMPTLMTLLDESRQEIQRPVD